MSYFSVPDGADEDGYDAEGLEGQNRAPDAFDLRTPLDRTIDRIGMGNYQWILLSLCGLGWLADNMWLEAIAIVLPRVQRHYDVSDNMIGSLSSSMFAGMMVGAVGWGACSDSMGRTTAFNATLCLTALFGILSGLTTSFLQLCITLFLLGSAVGGSMPTDGTLFLENVPKGRQYLLTALSVFFSIGSVVAAGVALLAIPGRACTGEPSLPCDVNVQNTGWKYLLGVLGVLTLCMFLARVAFFRIHESPRYLVTAGRHQEALESLQMISRFNGSELSIDIRDVCDRPVNASGRIEEATPFLDESLRRLPDTSAAVPASAQQPPSTRPSMDAQTILDPSDLGETAAHTPQHGPRHLAAQRSSDLLNPSANATRYDSTSDSDTPLSTHVFATPVQEEPPAPALHTHARTEGSTSFAITDSLEMPRDEHTRTASVMSSPTAARRTHPPHTRSRMRRRSSMVSRSSYYEVEKRVGWKLPDVVRRPLLAWLDRVSLVLAPEWWWTTILVWLAWGFMALAYTMFNVFLPKLLETKGAADLTRPKSLQESLWDVMIFTIGGCPGAILGAWMVESRLGRRWSLAGSTFITGFFCAVFIMVQSAWAVRVTTMAISLSVTTMWAVLYGWTPEIFGTEVRGTACGIASALSRIGGMIAPMLGGALLAIDDALPVYVSIATFLAAGVCVVLLDPPESDDAGTDLGGPSIMH
ncbi:MFS general substrate transporter, partial [Punctularia strigosozonata HHB-11173 SS5]|uniref:MFS general substrate transporter n=1 Tax=Punctularia strigosozonata (strain HHB-11173) TaxID=741275 RepID=UPI0004417E29